MAKFTTSDGVDIGPDLPMRVSRVTDHGVEEGEVVCINTNASFRTQSRASFTIDRRTHGQIVCYDAIDLYACPARAHEAFVTRLQTKHASALKAAMDEWRSIEMQIARESESPTA